jgi:hypothetical protein
MWHALCAFSESLVAYRAGKPVENTITFASPTPRPPTKR